MSRGEEFHVGSNPLVSAQHSALAYRTARGFSQSPQGSGRVVVPQSAQRDLAQAYHNMPSFDRRALPAFHAMREEIGRQFDHLTKSRSRGGMGIDVESTSHDPYGQGPRGAHTVLQELRHDVGQNNRIKVLSTQATGGHPVFTNDQNDMFRAIHDVYGHLGSGRGIDSHGEDAAYREHRTMFTPLARQAVATETRGQNAAFNVTGQFQEQKVALLPRHMQSPQFTTNLRPMSQVHEAVFDARRTHLDQGIGDGGRR